MSTGEADVGEYSRNHIDPCPNSTDDLKRSDRQPMAKHVVLDTGSKLKVSNSVPDMP